MKALSTFFCMVFLSLNSHAFTPFEQHFQNVSQSMSAFYMYELSQGDERYMQQFKRFKSRANRALLKMKGPEYSEFKKRWHALKVQLAYENVRTMGLSLDRAIRLEFRSYLIDLYLTHQKHKILHSKINQTLAHIQILNSVLSARALDVTSSLYGHRAFGDHDRLLDQKAVALHIEQDIKQLMKKNLSKALKTTLRKVSTTFAFMKKSLTEYEGETAYFLLYSNIASINKLLNQSQKNESIANL